MKGKQIGQYGDGETTLKSATIFFVLFLNDIAVQLVGTFWTDHSSMEGLEHEHVELFVVCRLFFVLFLLWLSRWTMALLWSVICIFRGTANEQRTDGGFRRPSLCFIYRSHIHRTALHWTALRAAPTVPQQLMETF